MSQKIEKIHTVQYARHRLASHYGILLNKNRLSCAYPIHQHDFYEFEIVIDGAVYNSINGESRMIGRGDFYCLSPDAIHKVTRCSNDVMIYNISVFLPDTTATVRDAISRFSFPSRGKLSEEKLSFLSVLYDALFSDARQNAVWEEEKVGALVTYILLELAGEVTDACGSFVRDRGNAYIRAAMAVVREEYAHELPLGAVAERVGLSAGYLSTLFSSLLGTSFKEYLSATRVSHAMNLLATSELSVTEIAFSCGFGSFSNFERVFSRIVGMTPGEYRKTKGLSE